MSLFTKQKQTHRHRKQIFLLFKEEEVGGINWGFEINIFTLLRIQ